MSKTQLLGFFFLLLFIGLSAYAGVSYILSGQPPLSIQGFFTYITTNVHQKLTGLIAWAQDKLIIILGALGTTVSATLGTYNLVRGQLNQAKSQAQEAQNTLASVTVEARREIEQLQTEKQGLEKQLSDLQNQDYPKLLAESQAEVTAQARTIQSKDATIQDLSNLIKGLKLKEATVVT